MPGEIPSKVSVVIPAYNAGKYLAQTLESIALQTHPAHEVWVVDDASPEPFDDIVKSFQERPDFPTLHLLRQGRNRGQAAARNAGMDASSGDFIAFLDSDDIWHPQHLQQSLSTLEKSDATLTYSPAVMFRDGAMDNPIHILRPMYPGEEQMDPIALLGRCFVVLSSVVVRADFMRRHGHFDEGEEVRAAEDLDCLMNLLKAGAVFRMLDQPTLYYRKHPGSATGRIGHIERQSCRVICRHIDWVPGSRRTKRKLLARTHWRTAFQLKKAGADDHRSYLWRAIGLSLGHPLFLGRRLWKYASGLITGSNAGNH